MLFSNDTLKAYAASKGITGVEDAAFDVLSQELEYRIKELCQEASKFMHASHRTKLTVDDVNLALTSRNIDPLFGYDPSESLNFKAIGNFYAVPDEEFEIEDFLNRPLPRISPKSSVHAHWLAIEGIQPQIPQNPLPNESRKKPQDSLQGFLDDTEMRPNVKHVLSKELQAYFDKILEFTTFQREDAIYALQCLENDSGIQQLIPYFIQAFRTCLSNNKDEFRKDVIVAMIFALLRNKYIFVDPYLHQIVPALLTGVLGKHFSMDTREMSIVAVKYVYDRFSGVYNSLAPRTINTLKNAWLDKKKPDSIQYAALKCLCILGDAVIKDAVVPNAQTYIDEIGKSDKVLSLLKQYLKKDI